MSAPVMTMEPPTTSPTAEPPLRMSFEEWLAWDYEGGLTEWVNGEVMIYMAATETHQTLVEFVDRLLALFVKLFGFGKVHTGPYAMRAIARGSGREPDVMFVATANLSRMEDQLLNGPADLVVEVVSDDSVSRDYDRKFVEYQNGGVREYWIIDPRPDRQRAAFFVLNARGRFAPVPVGDDGIYRSTVLPNFWLTVDWLWAADLTPMAALTEIVGMDAVIAAVRDRRL